MKNLKSHLEVLLFRLYYKIPFFSYQQKRRFILLFHHYFEFLTKYTLSYQIYQMTATETDRGIGFFQDEYSQWIKKYDYLLPDEYKKLQQTVDSRSSRPMISIILTIRDSEDHRLNDTIASVMAQSYSYWELCIIGDAATRNHLSEALGTYSQSEPRIRWFFKDKNNSNSVAFNEALNRIAGEFIVFIDPQGLLAPHALLWIALDILNHPEGMLWYSDEDTIDENGRRKNPHFKPDWNPDLFLSYPYNLVSHLGVYRTDLVHRLNGLRQEYENALEFDLALRIIEKISPSQIRHIPRILYHRCEAASTLSTSAEEISFLEAALTAVNDYLHRTGTQARAVQTPDRLYIRVQYNLPEKLPLVTLIVPTFNGLELLKKCIESIVKKTSYHNYEIIVVNNNSDDPGTLRYLQDLKQSPIIKVFDYPYSFNYSAINNMAVKYSRGELIGFLNNDTEVINNAWLTEMVSHALRPEIGAVGARLWYKNDTLQHGGVILGINGVANHIHRGIAKGEPGYFGRAILIQNFSAVTAACLVMRRDCFTSVGGFNEEQLAVAFNDVDLCLKLIKSGLRIVWTPYAELYHYESASRGYDNTLEKIRRSQQEIVYMQEKWSKWLTSDPFYNPNLTLETEDFSLAWPPRLEKFRLHGETI